MLAGVYFGFVERQSVLTTKAIANAIVVLADRTGTLHVSVPINLDRRGWWNED
jgi:hypothetical protein